MGYIQKALMKGYSEHPRFACCTGDMSGMFVRFGRCLCCSLPRFVNRQLPCVHTNSHPALLHPQMHHNNPWFRNGHAMAGQTGSCHLSHLP